MRTDEILDDELSDNMVTYLKENTIFREWIKDAMYKYASENEFEVAHHFYRQGFFEQKSEQFERHYEAYLKEKKLWPKKKHFIGELCHCGNPTAFKEMEQGNKICSKCNKPF